MAASARPTTATSCAAPDLARIVVPPHAICRLNPEVEPVCAKVNCTSIRSPGSRPPAGMSQPPRLVEPVALVLVPAALQITCAAAVETGPPPDVWPEMFPPAEVFTRSDAVRISP